MSEITIQRKIDRLLNCRDDFELTSCKRNICEKSTSCKGNCSHCKIQFIYDELFLIIPERIYND